MAKCKLICHFCEIEYLVYPFRKNIAQYCSMSCSTKGMILKKGHYPELRFSVDNGRTLCIECHRFTPNYGMNSIRPSLKRLLVWEKKIEKEKEKFIRG